MVVSNIILRFALGSSHLGFSFFDFEITKNVSQHGVGLKRKHCWVGVACQISRAKERHEMSLTQRVAAQMAICVELVRHEFVSRLNKSNRQHVTSKLETEYRRTLVFHRTPLSNVYKGKYASKSHLTTQKKNAWRIPRDQSSSIYPVTLRCDNC